MADKIGIIVDAQLNISAEKMQKQLEAERARLSGKPLQFEAEIVITNQDKLTGYTERFVKDMREGASETDKLLQITREYQTVQGQIIKQVELIDQKTGETYRKYTNINENLKERQRLVDKTSQAEQTAAEKELKYQERIRQEKIIQNDLDRKAADAEVVRIAKRQEKLGVSTGLTTTGTGKADLAALQPQLQSWAGGSDTQIVGVKKLQDGITQLTVKTQLSADTFKMYKINIDEANGSMYKLSETTSKSPNKDMGFMGMMKTAMEKFPIWIVASTLVMGSIHQLQQGIQSIIDLDSKLAQINMGMNATKDQLQVIAKGSQDIAISMGSTVKDVLQIADIYGNVNETAESIMTKTKQAVILSNISGMSGTETTNALQGIQEQFNITDEGLSHVNDALSTIASNLKVNFQTSIQQMAEGVKTAGAMANQAGIPFEKFASVIGVTAEKTRLSGSQIANSLFVGALVA